MGSNEQLDGSSSVSLLFTHSAEGKLKPSTLKIVSTPAEKHGASFCFCSGSCQDWKQSFVYQELQCISAFASGARCYFKTLLCAIVDK